MTDFSSLFNSLSTLDYVVAVVSIIALFPAIRLLYLYKERRIAEYFLYSMVFVLVGFTGITDILSRATNDLIFWILTNSFKNMVYFVILLHVVRLNYTTLSRYLAILGVIWYSIIQFLLFFWKPLPTRESGIGAGLKTTAGVVIYSDSQTLIADLYQFFVAVLFMYSFAVIKLSNPNKRINLALRLYQFAAGILLLMTAAELVEYTGLFSIEGAYLIVIVLIILAVDIWTIPEAVLLASINIEGLLILSYTGLPLAKIRYDTFHLSVGATFVAGFISMIQNSVLELMTEETALEKIQFKKDTILISEQKGITFILFASHETPLVKASLEEFKRLFFDKYGKELTKIIKSGELIEDTEISLLMEKAFPYTVGRKSMQWDI